MWGCKPHWFALPEFLRDLVWEAYVPGQETRKTPSETYLRVAHIVQLWIEAAYTPSIRTKKKGVLRVLTSTERTEMTRRIRKVVGELQGLGEL